MTIQLVAMSAAGTNAVAAIFEGLFNDDQQAVDAASMKVYSARAAEGLVGIVSALIPSTDADVAGPTSTGVVQRVGGISYEP